MIGRGILIFAGIVSTLLGLILTLLIIGMFQQPGGIGAEKLLGPIFIVLGLFFISGVCFYAASRISRPRPSAWPRGLPVSHPRSGYSRAPRHCGIS